MARSDFVTIDDDEETCGFRKYLSPKGGSYPNPSNMLFSVDPAFVPEDLLVELVSPDENGESLGQLTERPLCWKPWDLSVFEIDLEPSRVLMNGTCPFCDRRTEPEGLDAIWDGRDICYSCTPDRMRELQKAGYRYAESVARDDSGNEEMAWWRALGVYVAVLKEAGELPVGGRST